MNATHHEATPTTRIARALLATALLATGPAALAKVYQCHDPTGRPIAQDTPCPVVNAPPPAPAAPPCALSAEQRQRAMRAEGQFLGRFADARSHHGAQLAELQTVGAKLRLAGASLDQLRQQARPIESELEFYRGKPVPAGLQAKADANVAQTTAMIYIFRNLGQEVTDVEARYRCERETFGKLWSGAPPGSSACNRPACALP